MKTIEFYAGSSIESAWQKLQEYSEQTGKPCSGVFNGKEILSSDSIDEAYAKVVGVPKSEFDEQMHEQKEKDERELAEHKAKIPTLTEEYREKARGVIPNDKLELWDRIVPIRLNDLYRGMELDCWLDLIAVLNEDTSKEERFEACKEVFNKQGHSGMSAGLVFSGLKQFHTLGDELVAFIKSNT